MPTTLPPGRVYAHYPTLLEGYMPTTLPPGRVYAHHPTLLEGYLPPYTPPLDKNGTCPPNNSLPGQVGFRRGVYAHCTEIE